MNYAFLLWREFKLSIAEIQTVFPEWETVFCDKQIIILSNIGSDGLIQRVKNLWGTIKVFEVQETHDPVEECIYQETPSEWKFKYGLSVYGQKKNLKEILLKIKKYLKNEGISSRYTNKDNKNLSSAQIIGENLLKREADFNYIYANKKYFGKTIWVQDINAYSKRDYGKDRDMQIGMLPPKLAQMMVNISEGSTVYDPFVGLGTVLIESVIKWNTTVFGSDLNERMVETSLYNLQNLFSQESKNGTIKIMKLNAKFIEESPYFDMWVDAIVTEWYLGEIMTQKNISLERIEKQRESLTKIYEWFFAGLSKINFQWNVVISFPFREIKGKYFYFEEIYTLLQKYCDVIPLLKKSSWFLPTKVWSLLYKREKQLVGREIFKLKIK